MNNNILRICLFVIAVFYLQPIPLAFADHDDGDDVEKYEYVLRFDPKDLLRYKGFIVIDEYNKDYEEEFKIQKNIGEKHKHTMQNSNDLKLVWSGYIPIIVWGILDSQNYNKIESWIDSLSNTHDGKKYGPLIDHDLIITFRKKFESQTIPIRYNRSIVLDNMLILSGCRKHFLKAKGSALIQVTESVKIETGTSGCRIVSTGYRFEYKGHPEVNLTADAVMKMEKADYEKLLNVDGTIKPVFNEPFDTGVYDLTKSINEIVSVDPKLRFPLKWLWFIGGPAVGVLGLAILYIRKRRNA